MVMEVESWYYDIQKKANKPFGVGNIQSELIKSGGEALTQACDNFVNVIWKAEN